MNKFIGLLAGLALMLLIELFCIKVGWEMFAVPVFNLKELTWEQAMGLAVLASCLQNRVSYSTIAGKKE